MKKTWLVKSGEGRQAAYVHRVTEAGDLIWGLRDEAMRFQDLTSARATLHAARLVSPKSGARLVRLVRIGEEWEAMRDALEANDRAIAGLDAIVMRLAKMLGVSDADLGLR